MYSKVSKSLLSVRVRRPVASASGKCTLLMETATSTNERGKEQDQPATHGDRTRHVTLFEGKI